MIADDAGDTGDPDVAFPPWNATAAPAAAAPPRMANSAIIRDEV